MKHISFHSAPLHVCIIYSRSRDSKNLLNLLSIHPCPIKTCRRGISKVKEHNATIRQCQETERLSRHNSLQFSQSFVFAFDICTDKHFSYYCSFYGQCQLCCLLYREILSRFQSDLYSIHIVPNRVERRLINILHIYSFSFVLNGVRILRNACWL